MRAAIVGDPKRDCRVGTGDLGSGHGAIGHGHGHPTGEVGEDLVGELRDVGIGNPDRPGVEQCPEGFRRPVVDERRQEHRAASYQARSVRYRAEQHQSVVRGRPDGREVDTARHHETLVAAINGQRGRRGWKQLDFLGARRLMRHQYDTIVYRRP